MFFQGLPSLQLRGVWTALQGSRWPMWEGPPLCVLRPNLGGWRSSLLRGLLSGPPRGLLSGLLI